MKNLFSSVVSLSGYGMGEMKKILEWIKYWFTQAMTVPDVNSRLVFLVSGLGSILAVLILTVAFLFAHDRSGFDYMVMAVSGGAVGHGVSRYLTKKNGGDDKEKEEAPHVGD